MNDYGAVVTARLLFVFMCGFATLAQAAPATHEHRRREPSVPRVLATERVGAHSSGRAAVAPHAVAAGTSGRRGYEMHVRNESGHVGEAVAWVNSSSATSRGCSFVPGRPGRANDDDDDDDDDDDRKGWGGLLGALTLLYSQRKRFGL